MFRMRSDIAERIVAVAKLLQRELVLVYDRGHVRQEHPTSGKSLEDLIRACAQTGDQSGWEEFVCRFHPLIAGVAMRTAQRWGNASPDLVDDLVQETYLKLCTDPSRLLGVFDSCAPETFYGYLKVVTTNVAHDYFRSVHSQKRNVEMEVPLESSSVVWASAAGNAAQVERTALLGEVDTVLEDVARGPNQRRDCTIFWLYYRQGLTADAIARLPGFDLSVKGVESLLHRLTRMVRERLTEPRYSVGA